MKRIVTKFCLIASLLIILSSFGAWQALVEFFFAGIIPGTDTRLAPGLMLMLLSISLGLVISSVFVLPQMRKYDFSNKKQI